MSNLDLFRVKFGNSKINENVTENTDLINGQGRQVLKNKEEEDFQK